ncbi:MAG TPA: Ig-like domain-containing protein [Gemmatimonadaceae bacterium]
MRPDNHKYRSALASRKTASRNRFAPFIGILGALALAVLVACGDAGTGPDREVASVAVSPSARTLGVGEAAVLAATVQNRAGDPLEGVEVEWESDDATVVAVSQDGRIEALRAGAAVVVATSAGKHGSARITVTDATPPPATVARVEVDPAALALPKYETRRLGARALDADGNELEGRQVVWSSENGDVAEVDQSGLVTAKSPGWTRILATVEGKSAFVDLTVGGAPVARVVLAPAGPELDRGEIVQLDARLEDAYGVELEGRTIAWSSTDATVLRVEGPGQLFALRDGLASITATSEGRSASIALRVVPPPAFDLLFDAPLAAGGAQIFLLELGRPTVPTYLNAGNVSRDPSPSPDGERFVFAVSQRDLTTGAPQHDLYVVNMNGMQMRRLTSMPGIEQEPAWSPDGTRIAFSATGEDGRLDIWVVNVDGSGLANLTAGMDAWVASHAPAWSPDGERIAFATSFDGIAGAIWTMRADGSDRVQLVGDVAHGLAPSWSPDGARIAFHYFAGIATGMDIATVAASGGAATRLARPGDQTAPAWSPDGALIAFTSSTTTGVPQLWTMRPDGTGARIRASVGRNASWIDR